MKTGFPPFALLAVVLLVSTHLWAQENVTEPSTGKSFPSEIKIQHNGTDLVLNLTGVAVRKKIIFKVYAVAHYMQDPLKGAMKEVLSGVLDGGKAKQLVLDFARDVEAPKIQDAYKDGFKEHLSPEQLQKIQPLIDRFVGYFGKDVKENDRFILRWLPPGIVVAIVQGDEKPAIDDGTFARALWSIWLGEDSIVDHEALVARIVTK